MAWLLPVYVVVVLLLLILTIICRGVISIVKAITEMGDWLTLLLVAVVMCFLCALLAMLFGGALTFGFVGGVIVIVLVIYVVVQVGQIIGYLVGQTLLSIANYIIKATTTLGEASEKWLKTMLDKIRGLIPLT